MNRPVESELQLSSGANQRRGGRLTRWAKDHPVRTIAGVAGACIVAGGIGGGLGLWKLEVEQREAQQRWLEEHAGPVSDGEPDDCSSGARIEMMGDLRAGLSLMDEPELQAIYEQTIVQVEAECPGAVAVKR